MPGDLATGQRVACSCSCSARRAHAGDDLPGQAGSVERPDLFIQAPEYGWITSLETHDHPMLAGMRHQKVINFSLGEAGLPAALADRNMLCLRRPFQHLFGEQCIVQHDIGLGQDTNRPDRQQIGSPRARSNEPDLACHSVLHERQKPQAASS